MSFGSIHLILGPMFSGKTTELIRRINRFKLSNHKCVIIKHRDDRRYSDIDLIYTHDKGFTDALSTDNLCSLITKLENVDVVGIDEGQFFEDVAEFSERMANRGKIVIVSALNGDYRRRLFGGVFKLLPLSETIRSLTAICMGCYKEASFSKRITADNEVKVIGGKETYVSVCRECFFNPAISGPKRPTRFPEDV